MNAVWSEEYELGCGGSLLSKKWAAERSAENVTIDHYEIVV